MYDKYIVDGSVDRVKIVRDIAYRKIGRTEIEALVADPMIQAGFIGDSYTKKLPKSKWNSDYLNLLPLAAVGETFNRDYLLHLDEVAEYVSKPKYKKIVIAGVVILVVIVAGVIVCTRIL